MTCPKITLLGAAVLIGETVGQYMNLLSDTPVHLQQKVMILVSFMGGIRRAENHALLWDNFTFIEEKQEVFVHIPKTKGNKKGRTFAITSPVFFQLLTKYRQTIIKLTKEKRVGGYFYRLWNKPAKCWNINRRGKSWFQDVPRDIAIFLKKNDPDKFSHHSFRKTMATELAAAGASTPLCQLSGAWKSSKSLNIYIIDTDHNKRKIAHLLDSTSTVDIKKKSAPEPEKALTPARSPASLMHGANGTVVQATNMGSIGAWNLRSCKVEIHHHIHQTPEKTSNKEQNPVVGNIQDE